jgi:hypothetical protein
MKSFQEFRQLIESKEVVDEGIRNVTPEEAHKMLKDIGDDVVWKDYYQLRSDKQRELHALGKKLKMKAPGSGKELGRHVHDVLQNKVSKLREETEQLDEKQKTWRVEIPGIGLATVKGANETQAIDRALAQRHVRKSERSQWISGMGRKDVKLKVVE